MSDANSLVAVSPAYVRQLPDYGAAGGDGLQKSSDLGGSHGAVPPYSVPAVTAAKSSTQARQLKRNQLASGAINEYTGLVDNQHGRIDKPEPRWQALLAFLAVGTIYVALPRDLIVGPIWLLPTLIVVLLIPTVVSHRSGHGDSRGQYYLT